MFVALSVGETSCQLVAPQETSDIQIRPLETMKVSN